MPVKIHDSRKEKDFAKISFSNYKKSAAIKQLKQNILCNKIEESCYWSAELLCAGHVLDIWNVVFEIMSKHIHAGNPKLPIYVYMRYDIFKKIANDSGNILMLRNDENIRQLFCEIMCVLCISNKKHAIARVKVHKEEYNFTVNTAKLQAPATTYGDRFINGHDPPEIRVCINEFSYCLEKNVKNTWNACFWVEWLLEFLKRKVKEKKKFTVIRRKFVPVPDKDQSNAIWIIWEVILHYSKRLNDRIASNVIQNLFNLFVIRYTKSINTRRVYIIYHAISLITENHNVNIDVIRKGSKQIEEIKGKVSRLYSIIKKNEIVPPPNYLFTNINIQQ